MKNQTLDIIIVNFNSSDYTIKCIHSIYASRMAFQIRIIVVDNGSYDYPDRIKQTFPEIDLFINKKNHGFAKAVNFGISKSTSETTILLNPDTAIYDGFFDSAFRYMDAHKDVAVIGPQVLDNDGAIQGSARRFPNVFTSIFGRRSPLTRIFPNNPITKREFVCFNGCDKPMDVDWVSGACMVVRKKAFEAIGGFDERFFMYWEDTDLCRRLRSKGWRIVYLPEAQIFHHAGISSDTEPILSIFHFHQSCFLLCYKHVNRAKRLLLPLAFLGLAMRCMAVMGWNSFTRMKERTPQLDKKEKYFN